MRYVWAADALAVRKDRLHLPEYRAGLGSFSQIAITTAAVGFKIQMGTELRGTGSSIIGTGTMAKATDSAMTDGVTSSRTVTTIRVHNSIHSGFGGSCRSSSLALA
jgi:hypothetical protein